MRILYVEDNTADADLTRIALKKSVPHYSLETVSRISAATERLQNATNYDLVLLDLQLPDGHGIDLLLSIREQKLPLAVLILTGSGDQQAVIAALKAGADDYLSKEGDYLKRLPSTLKAARQRFLKQKADKARIINVLYAESTTSDIDLTRRHFRQYAPNIRLEFVSNSAQVLTQLSQNDSLNTPYDVLLFDYSLPRLDALELTKILRNEYEINTPIMLVTGQGNESIASQALHLGIDNYVVKHDGYLYELVATLEKISHHSELIHERGKLKETNAKLSHLIASSPVILYKLEYSQNNAPRATWVSDNISTELGFSPSEALEPGWWLNHIHPEDRAKAENNFATLLRNKHLVHEYRFYDKTGHLTWIQDELRILDDGTNKDCETGFELIGAWHNISERKYAEEELRRSAAVFEATRDGVFITDLTPKIVAVNPAFTTITGYSKQDVMGKNPKILGSHRHNKEFFRKLWHYFSLTGHWQGEILNRRKNGELYPQWLTISIIKDEQQNHKHYVGVFTDISQLKQSQNQLEHLAHYDPLTKLPNRLLIQSRLNHALEQANRHNHSLGVLFVDLDNFKTVNDSLGHPVGDELLNQVAIRMSTRLREEDSLGRLGGDEFLILIEQMNKPRDAVDVALSLLDRLQQPFVLSGGQEVFVGCSIGISLFPDDASSVTELIQHADSAMYLAKQEGRNTYRFYTESLTLSAHHRLQLETNLRRALERNEFILHYQPLLCGAENEITGVEALLRWQDPDQGIVAPGQFIGLAEETGLIVPIGEWVLYTACTQARIWLDNGCPRRIAVNLSPVQFKNQDMVALVRSVLTQTGLPAKLLELEITESTLMEQGEQAFSTLSDLKSLGVYLAIDDFGTGYSSLAYLRLFPLDTLKIDRSFVDGLGTDENDQAIVKAIIAMAHSLGIKTLAEGVETQQQHDILKQLGCEYYQGYLFSKPLPAENMPWKLPASNS